MTQNVSDVSHAGREGYARRLAVRFGIPLASLIFPALAVLTLHANPKLGPIFSLIALLSVCFGAWWGGYAPGLVTAVGMVMVVTWVSTGRPLFPLNRLGDQWLTVPFLVTVVISLLTSWVAATRKQLEALLRRSNAELEERVRERTEELGRSRESLQITLSSIGDGVIATDVTGNVTLMNGVSETLTGWKAREAAGRPLEEVFHIVNEYTRAAAENPVQKVLRSGLVVGLANHTLLIRKDGTEYPIDDSAAPIRTADGAVAGVVLVFREVGERRRAEREHERLLEELQRARARAEHERSHILSVFQQAPVAINIFRGPNHMVELLHPLTRARLGGSDVTGLPIGEHYAALRESGLLEDMDEAYRLGATRRIDAAHMPFRQPDGQVESRYFDIIFTPWRDLDGQVTGVMSVANDVTAQVLAEKSMEATQERLRETAKLESLGVLAGGIAHDFNNLLVGILGNASMALEMLPERAGELREVIEDVVSASEKAAVLTKQMLAYSGKGKFMIEPLDLSRLVEEIVPLVTRSSRSVLVDCRCMPDLPPVMADRSQLQQVAMNLVLNAVEACQQSGVVTISTRPVHSDPLRLPPTFGLPPIEPGVFLCLEVRDTGCGISEETRAKIFDPFFTTKFTGRGLGLSAVLGIIRAHRGGIEVESEVGRGTTFRVYFPAAGGSVSEYPARQPQRRELTGVGTILVVDDEDVVRKMARLTLGRYGYQVLVAEHGEEALSVLGTRRGKIDLVILDLTMPVMGGEAALPEIRRIDPAAKVILSSGFSEAEATERFKGKDLHGFLQKPYSSTTLAEHVRSVLRQ